MQISWRHALFVFGLSISVGACAPLHKIEGTGGLVNSESLPVTATVDWTLMRTSVLRTCADCHTVTQNPHLVSLDDFRQNISQVWDQVSKGAMPPRIGGRIPLSKCRLAAVKKWMDLGLPAESNARVADLPECLTTTPEPPITQMPVNYQTLRDRILVPRCDNCHCPDASCTGKLILFEPYATLVGDPQQRWSAPGVSSRAVKSVTRTDKFRMPPLNDSDALSTDEIQFIVKWIDLGKPEF